MYQNFLNVILPVDYCDCENAVWDGVAEGSRGLFEGQIGG